MTDIPAIMLANGWTHGAALMLRWLSNPVVGLVLSEVDTTTITMEWVLRFDRAKKVYDEMFRDKIYMNNKAIEQMGREIKKKESKFGNLDLPIEQLHEYHINHREVGSNWDPTDDLKAALGRFSFYIAVGGTVSCFQEEITVTIIDVGVYVRDSYDFEDLSGFLSQALGYWKKETNYGGSNWFKGSAVRNKDFRNYREKTGVGRDFMVFSDLKKTHLPAPVKVKVPK